MTRPAPRDDIAAMAGYHSPQLEVEVRLNTNESPVPPPPEFTAALRDAVAAIDWNRYPDRGATTLRARIGANYGVGPEQVFVANGSNEVLQNLLLAYGGSGRTALTFEPTYAMHSQIARTVGTTVVQAERNRDFVLDPDVAREVVADRRPDVVFVCSPNNPTGMIEPQSLIEALLDDVEQYGGLLVVDEAYGQFAPWSATELVADDRNLVVTRTFSKTWSMAAARLGYLVGPSWLVETLEIVTLPYHLDAFKQAAGLAALEGGDAMRDRVASLVAERERVVTGLAKLEVTVWPSAANFVLFRPDSEAGAEVWQRMVDDSVLVRNCSSWERLDGCLRVTIGSPAENDAFLAALERALR